MMFHPLKLIARSLIALIALIVLAGAYVLQTGCDLIRRQAAFQRMKANTYGQCTACGDDISMRRLENDPAARRCTTCVSQARA